MGQAYKGVDPAVTPRVPYPPEPSLPVSGSALMSGVSLPPLDPPSVVVLSSGSAVGLGPSEPSCASVAAGWSPPSEPS
jgi:hypothetical protein